jgi:hypothetical protein
MGGSFRPVAHLSCLRCGCARRPGQRRVPPIAVVFCSSPRLPLRSSSTPFALPLLSKLESIHPFLGFGRVLEIETRPVRRGGARRESRPIAIFFPGGEAKHRGKKKRKGWCFDSYLLAGLCGGCMYEWIGWRWHFLSIAFPFLPLRMLIVLAGDITIARQRICIGNVPFSVGKTRGSHPTFGYQQVGDHVDATGRGNGT